LGVDSVGPENIQLNGVRSGNIAPGAVGTTRIADGAVTRVKLSFTPTETVSAGSGLSGGGTGRNLSLSVNFGSVARADHGHPHSHSISSQTGTTSGSGLPAHSHGVNVGTSSALSSVRYKKDMQDYEFDTSKLFSVKLKKFRYKNKYKDHKANRDWFFGYSAEELSELGLEEVLNYDQNGDPHAVNYSLIGVFALELLKDHEKRIKDLETKLGAITQ
jgi:hypothetical protein